MQRVGVRYIIPDPPTSPSLISLDGFCGRKAQSFLSFLLSSPAIGYAEIKVPSVEKPVLPKVLPLRPGVGQNIAVHASSTARNFSLSNCCLCSPFIFICSQSSFHFSLRFRTRGVLRYICCYLYPSIGHLMFVFYRLFSIDGVQLLARIFMLTNLKPCLSSCADRFDSWQYSHVGFQCSVVSAIVLKSRLSAR